MQFNKKTQIAILEKYTIANFHRIKVGQRNKEKFDIPLNKQQTLSQWYTSFRTDLPFKSHYCNKLWDFKDSFSCKPETCDLSKLIEFKTWVCKTPCPQKHSQGESGHPRVKMWRGENCCLAGKVHLKLNV